MEDILIGEHRKDSGLLSRTREYARVRLRLCGLVIGLMVLTSGCATPVAVLTKRLGSEDVSVRRAAASEISYRVRPRHFFRPYEYWAEAVPSMIEALQDPDPLVRMHMANAFVFLGSNAPEAAPFLVEALGDEAPEVRFAAANALARIGEITEEAVPVLIEALGREGDFQVRRDAAKSLGYMGGEAKGAVSELIVALDDEHENVAFFAANTLKSLGPAASEAVPKFLSLMDSENMYVRWYSAKPTLPIWTYLRPSRAGFRHRT